VQIVGQRGQGGGLVGKPRVVGGETSGQLIAAATRLLFGGRVGSSGVVQLAETPQVRLLSPGRDLIAWGVTTLGGVDGDAVVRACW